MSQITNKKAHELHNTFKALCDVFNQCQFKDMPLGAIIVWQKELSDCLDLFRFLRSKEDCIETKAYEYFTLKMLDALSVERDCIESKEKLQ